MPYQVPARVGKPFPWRVARTVSSRVAFLTYRRAVAGPEAVAIPGCAAFSSFRFRSNSAPRRHAPSVRARPPPTQRNLPAALLRADPRLVGWTSVGSVSGPLPAVGTEGNRTGAIARPPAGEAGTWIRFGPPASAAASSAGVW